MNIRRDLPNDEYQAAVGASAPSASNVFATINDLSGFVSGNIYTTNGVIGAGRVATLTDTLTFAASQGVSFVSPLTTDSTIEIDALTAANDSYIKFSNGGAQQYAIGYDGGAGTFKISGTSFTGGFTNFFTANSTLLHAFISNAYNFGIGTSPGTSKFLVRGNGTTNATIGVTLEDSTGLNRVVIQDDGQTATHSGGAAAQIASFGNYHQSTGYSTAHAFYGRTGTSTTVFIQDTSSGANNIALNVAFQGAPTGVTTAIKGFQGQAGASTSIGVHGLARNATGGNYGVRGEIGGGWAASLIATPPTDVRAVYGNAAPNVDTIVYGGYFSSAAGVPANADTKDKIAVFGFSTNNSVASGAASKAIAGQFRTATSGGGGGTANIALHIPASGNDGVAVFGADTRNGASIVQATGDAELMTIGNGLIMKSPDNTRWKWTPDNTGALVPTLA